MVVCSTHSTVGVNPGVVPPMSRDVAACQQTKWSPRGMLLTTFEGTIVPS